MTEISPVSGAGFTGSEAAKEKKSAESGAAFSDALKKAVSEAMTEQSLTQTAAGSSAAAAGLSPGGGIQELLAASALSGEAGQNELALFMLMMLMQSTESSDTAPLMLAMNAILSGMGAGEESKALSLADLLETAAPAASSEGSGGLFGAVVPAQAWKPAVPAVTSDETDRSAALLRRVIDQFNVEGAERYTPYKYGRDTYCNIFVWDVTSALGCEIPHFVDASGDVRTYPDIAGARELNAPATQAWLLGHGARYGWREVSAEEAQAHANSGGPAVVSWADGGQGHVQIVCPSQSGGYDAGRGVSVSQSGRNNTGYAYESSTLTAAMRRGAHYFIHD